VKAKWILGLLVALGLALRVACARGDLWLDEIWTLKLVEPLQNGFEVFWNISHDNNHYLNSLWMFELGQDSPAWLYRLPSILCGGLSVAVAGRIGFRTSPAAGLIAGLLVAVAFPFVNYGSEARGYGGLILAMLVALSAFDRVLPLLGQPEQRRELRRQSWIMALALGLGALAHLEMLVGAAVLGLTAFVYAIVGGARDERRLRLLATVKFFLPSALLILPAIAATVGGFLLHGMTLGGVSYVEGGFVAGYGGLLASLAGAPASVPAGLTLLLAGACLGAAALAGWLRRSSVALAFCGLVALPTAIFFLNPPNLQYPRYFLVFGTIFAMLLAELAGRLWTTRVGKALVAGALLLFGLGQATRIAALARDGRGDVAGLIAIMGDRPDPTYASQIKRAPEFVLDYYGRRTGVSPRRVPPPQACGDAPDYYVIGVQSEDAIADESVTLGPQACLIEYAETLDAPSSSLSGMHWRLFRRVDGEAGAAQSAARER
jgi:hypothetical protein